MYFLKKRKAAFVVFIISQRAVDFNGGGIDEINCRLIENRVFTSFSCRGTSRAPSPTDKTEGVSEETKNVIDGTKKDRPQAILKRSDTISESGMMQIMPLSDCHRCKGWGWSSRSEILLSPNLRLLFIFCSLLSLLQHFIEFFCIPLDDRINDRPDCKIANNEYA